MFLNLIRWEIARRKFARTKSWVDRRSFVDEKSSLIGNNKVYRDARVYESTIGKYTYVSSGACIVNSTLGSFCSIGPNALIGLGTHPLHWLSTHPAFYSMRMQANRTFATEDRFTEELLPVNIGNDVWIGAASTVLGGISIGNGAVVAAGAVVIEDVKPYSIVGGVPARFISKRFDDEKIAELIEWKWWNCSDEKLASLAQEFCPNGNWTVGGLKAAIARNLDTKTDCTTKVANVE